MVKSGCHGYGACWEKYRESDSEIPWNCAYCLH